MIKKSRSSTLSQVSAVIDFKQRSVMFVMPFSWQNEIIKCVSNCEDPLICSPERFLYTLP